MIIYLVQLGFILQGLGFFLVITGFVSQFGSLRFLIGKLSSKNPKESIELEIFIQRFKTFYLLIILGLFILFISVIPLSVGLIDIY